MFKKIALTLIPIFALMLVLLASANTSLAAPPAPNSEHIEQQVDTDDQSVLADELAKAGLSKEEISQVLDLNEQLRDAYNRKASTKEMEQMVNALNEEFAKKQSTEASRRPVGASFRWIGQTCQSGATATFRSGFGSVLSAFVTYNSPVLHINTAWNWSTKTRTYTTSQNELVFLHLVVGNSPHNHSAGCR